MRYILFIFCFLGAYSNAHAADTECAGFSEALKACKPYSCTMHHPKVSQFILTHTIKELQPDGRCPHHQTTPQGEEINCVYTERSRQLVAKMFAPGRDPTLQEKEALEHVFKDECTVIPPKSAIDKKMAANKPKRPTPPVPPKKPSE